MSVAEAGKHDEGFVAAAEADIVHGVILQMDGSIPGVHEHEQTPFFDEWIVLISFYHISSMCGYRICMDSVDVYMPSFEKGLGGILRVILHGCLRFWKN